MNLVKPPEPLQLSGNIRKNWLVFKQKLQLFITATEPEKPRPSAVKAAILLSTAGDEALEVYNNFSFTAGESKEDYDMLVRKFEEYCVDQGNEVYERHMFRLGKQEEAEPLERFLRDSKKQAKLCNFGTLEESMIRDQVVFGTNNAKVREKLLSDKDLNLQKAEEICKAAEIAAIQSAAWSNESLHVDVTRRTHRTKFANGTRCRNCNMVHAPERCPAYGKTCYVCKKRNHFAACCNNARRISEVHKAEESDENFDILGIKICGVTGDIGADWMVRGKIAGQEVQFKVDTGSQANLLPLTLFNRFAHASTPRKSAAVLSAYNSSTIKHVGVATKDLEINEAQHSVSFFIVKKGRQAILGLKTCQQFGLVPVTVDAVKVGDGQTKFQLAFPDLFSGSGCVRRHYKMVLREDAVPVVQPARRVPIALKGRLRQELQRMETASIIVKVDEPTEWVSPLVVVHKKDGTLRICMDPRAVNRSIKREHYPIPSREDIESELAGAQYFSRLDANAGFHQISLDEATSRICTFATPFGRYRFLRLPFGISSASKVFQKTLTEMFEGLPRFVPGRDLLLADLLSRAALPTGGGDQVEDVDVHTTQVVTSIISKATMLRLQKETLEDLLLSRNMKQMENGMAIDGALKLGHSSGELLQGRRLHATLPEYNVDGGIPVWKQQQSSRGRPLPPLEAGNVVRIKHGSWSRRTTVVRETAPRSYVVRTEDHGLLRRNRQHLLRTDENFNDKVSPEGNPNPDVRPPTKFSDGHRGNITPDNPLGCHQVQPAQPEED
ncbi:uncharacterized protein LOC142775550 [Rhipicephalus microplus]|uniref:uncharacterized protein LOC142775550 n=1 Tax=Rhipicephalus microplus TaxID=6941 RepID=UPI003F6D705C